MDFFKIDSTFLNQFFDYAAKKEVEKTDAEYEKSKRLIDTQISALLARNLYTNSSYFEIINQLNDSYLEAINVIQSDEFEKAKLEYD